MFPGAGQIDRVGQPGVRRQHRREAAARRLVQWLDPQPVSSRQVGGDRSLPSAVADHRYPSTRRQGCGQQQLGEVDQLGRSVHPDHPGGAARRVHHVESGGQSPGVGTGSPTAGLARADGEQDGVFSGRPQRPQSLDHAVAVQEALHVQRHDPGGFVVEQIGQSLLRGHVHLVADRDEPGDAESSVGGQVGQLQAELSALRDDPQRAGGELAPGELHICGRVVDAETVGTDQATPVLTDPSGQVPFGAFAPEHPIDPRGDAEEAAGTLVQRLLHRLRHRRGRHTEHHQPRSARDLPDRPEALVPLDRRPAGVDEVDGPSVRALEGAPGKPVPPLGRVGGRADHGDRLRSRNTASRPLCSMDETVMTPPSTVAR